MESIIAKKIIEHLDKHNLISHSQHGFTEEKPCFTNLLGFHSKVHEAIDNGESYDILYSDFSKTFDKVQSLLKEISVHGIDGKIFGCIKA